MPPKPQPSEKKQIRQFSAAMGVFLAAVVNSIIWYKNGAPNQTLYIVAAVFAAVGLAVPIAMKPVFWGWMKIAGVLGWINTRIILGIIFYVMFTPVGLITRLFRIDFLDRKWPATERATYWHRRDPEAERGKDGFERQF